MKKIKKKLPKNIKLLKTAELQRAIAEIITNPNKTWKKLKREKYMVPKSYFQNNLTLNLKPSDPTDFLLIPTYTILHSTMGTSRDPKTCRIDVGISIIRTTPPCKI
jgi:hypothetical protein